jgi:hypothetical protein
VVNLFSFLVIPTEQREWRDLFAARHSGRTKCDPESQERTQEFTKSKALGQAAFHLPCILVCCGQLILVTEQPTMGHLPIILGRTAATMGRPAIWVWLAACLALSGIMLAGLVALAAWLAVLVPDSGWMDWLFGGLAMALGSMAAWFLYPLFTPLLAGMLAEHSSRVVAMEYPDAPAFRPVSTWVALRMDAMVVLRALGWNLLLSPLYLIPVVNLLVYYALNGRLLGQEFYLLVARQHEDPLTIRQGLQSQKRQVFSLGVVLAILATLPLINLIFPVLASLVMAHFYYQQTPKEPAVSA